MNQQLDQNQYFTTYDLGCSAALVTEGFELVSLVRDNPKKVQFIFLRAKNIEKCVDDYFAGRLLVSARSLFDNTKMLKNRIYSSVWTWLINKLPNSRRSTKRGFTKTLTEKKPMTWESNWCGWCRSFIDQWQRQIIRNYKPEESKQQTYEPI